MAKIPKLAFICTGNTCRSAMAQFILKNKLASYQDLKIKVSSFGVSVTEKKMNEKARTALKNCGIKPTKFVPKQLTAEAVKGFDALVCMTDGIKTKLETEGYENVYSVNQLTKLGDVPDPYGQGQDVYDDCCKKIISCCDVMIEMLKEVLL